jgi:hypothetical protein
MKKLGVVAALLLVVACSAKTPPSAAPASGPVAAAPAAAAGRDVMAAKHDPASGKPDTSAVQIDPGIVLHLYEVVNATQGKFHVVAGNDVRDVTMTQGTPMSFTFGTRTLTLTIKSITPQGANVRVEAKGTN